jgi:type III secretion protein C
MARTATLFPMLLLLLSMLLLAASQARGAEFAFKAGRVNLSYQEKPLRDVLREFFAWQGVPAVISEKIGGAVTGKFNMSTEEFFRNLSSVFGLLPYYDGAVLYVYASSEATGRVISLRSVTPERFRQTLKEIDALDRRYMLRINESERLAQVSGPPRYVEAIEEVAAMLEDGAKGSQAIAATMDQYRPLSSTFKVFGLRYAWAQDTTMTVGGREIVVPGIASTLRRLVGNYNNGGGRDAGGSVSVRQSSSVNTVPKLRGSGMIGQDGSSLRRQPPESDPNAASGGYAPVAPGVGGMPAPAEGGGDPVAMVNVSLPRVEADARTNAVIIHDLPERLGRYDELIAALDVKPILVQIDAAIIDVSSDSIEKLGVNWGESQTNVVIGRGSNGADAAFRQSAVDLSNTIANGVVRGTQPGFGTVPLNGMTTIIGNMGRLFLAQVNLLAQEGKAFVHARPSVLTVNNTEAILENNQTFYVRVAGEREVDLFNITAGTLLRVTAAAVDDQGSRKVKLAIRIEDGAITGGVVDQIPIVQRSTVGTNAMIGEGQSLLIGGYSYEVNRDVNSKLPLLGDIPALGALFTFKNRNVSRAERMFMITPRIIVL